MTGVRISIDDKQLRQALRALARIGRDPSPALKALGPLLVSSTRNRMIAEQAPDGTKWEPLNPEYRRVEKRGPGILRERAMRGGLFGSLTSQVEGRTLRIGTNKIYGAVHQFGATIVPKRAPFLRFKLGGKTVLASEVTIPARPFLGISDDDRQTILEVFEDFAARVAQARR